MPITDGNALLVLNYTADEEPPVLVNFTMNMTSGKMYLTFSDTVNLTTFDPSSIIIQNGQNVTKGYDYYRLNGGVSRRSDDGLIITLTLTVDDLNAIKRNTNISVSRNTTYMVIEEGAIEDLSNNPLVAIPNGVAQQTSVFINDTAALILTGFNLDMDTFVLCLFFDETVNANSIDPSQLCIQNDKYDPQQYYCSNSTSSSVDNSTVIKIYLTKMDIKALNRMRMLSTNENDTFVSITSDFIVDMNGNPVEPIVNSSAFQVTNFTKDEINPQIESFDLNMNVGIITLSFSEVVSYSTIRPQQLTLYASNDTSNTTMYSLTGGYVVPSDDTILVLFFNSTDLNEIKRLTELAISNETTFLSLTNLTVEDTFFNPIVAVTNEMPLQVAGFKEDATPPQLVLFELDMNLGVLTLSFDETINASSVITNYISVENTVLSPMPRVTLERSTSSVSNSTTITIVIPQYDLDRIKLEELLATNVNDTFIQFLHGAVQDMNMNGIVMNVSRNVVYIEDQTSPELVSYELNLNTGELIISFDEAVNASSVTITSFTLYSSNTTNSSSYQLTDNSTVDLTNGAVITITIGENDLNLIKADYTLAVDNDTAYVTINVSSLADMSGNYNEAIDTPVATDDYIADITSPQLMSFVFDYNTGSLLLTFSETVNVDTFMPTEITLQSSMMNPASVLTITTEDMYTTENSTVIVLNLTAYDLNRMKTLSHFYTMIFLSPILPWLI